MILLSKNAGYHYLFEITEFLCSFCGISRTRKRVNEARGGKTVKYPNVRNLILLSFE